MVLQLVVFLSLGAPRAPQGPEIVLVGGGERRVRHCSGAHNADCDVFAV